MHYWGIIIFVVVATFCRGQPELKEKIATCVGLIGGILGNEAGRYVDLTMFHRKCLKCHCRILRKL